MTLPAARITDAVVTGHGCDAATTILSTLQATVTIQGLLAAVVGAPLAPHTILSGGSCVPHPGQIVNTGSSKVFIGGIPAARVGDSADLGAVSSGSSTVLIG
jgi:uncharacterized Zn-binding protein involved in type VI secretion